MLKEICEEGWSSERLQFKKLSLKDKEDMYEYTSDAECCRFLKWGPHKSINETELFIKKVIRTYDNPMDVLFGIRLACEDKLIGVIRIYNVINKKADISYILNPNYSGVGYMTEAVNSMIALCFEKLKLDSVNAYYAEGNVRSEKVMKRTGMVQDKDYESFETIKDTKVRIYKYRIEKREV